MKIAFAGFDHDHIFNVYNLVKSDSKYEITGIWEAGENVICQLEKSGITLTHNTYKDVLDKSGAEIIAIGACFSDRGQLVIEALKAGKHVMVDKPICTKTSELIEIKKLVKEKNLKLGCMLDMRYNPNICAVRDIVQSGKIGDIKTIYMGLQHPLHYKFRAPWYYEDGKHGGVINDIGIHGIDMIRYISDLTPQKTLAARCWRGFSPEERGFDDCGQVMGVLSNGAGMLLDTSYSIPDDACVSFKVNFEIFGTLGAVRFSWHNTPALVYYKDKEQPDVLEPTDIGNHTSWNDFIGEISGNTDLYLTTEDVLRSAEDTLLIQEQAITC